MIHPNDEYHHFNAFANLLVLAQLSIVLLSRQPSNVRYMTVIIDSLQSTQKDNEPSDKYFPE